MSVGIKEKQKREEAHVFAVFILSASAVQDDTDNDKDDGRNELERTTPCKDEQRRGEQRTRERAMKETRDVQNSSSAYPKVPKTLSKMIATNCEQVSLR